MKKWLLFIISMALISCTASTSGKTVKPAEPMKADDVTSEIVRQAEEGNAHAQKQLGDVFYNNGPQDYERALYWYQSSSKQGNTKAQLAMGIMYYNGQGVDMDYTMARGYFQAAADKGDANAIHNLATMYELGQGGEKNRRKAIELYKKAADKGLTASISNLSILYLQKVDVGWDNADLFDAMKMLKEASKNEDKTASGALGRIYYAQKDYENAFKYYNIAVEQGETSFLLDIGNMYYEGLGTKKDDKKSFQSYEKAADSGNIIAQRYVGYYYNKGIGVSQNYNKAAEWYKMAAYQGDAGALYFLGILYEKGLGVNLDNQEAAKMYAAAGLMGSKEAQRNLSVLYLKGLVTGSQESIAGCSWAMLSGEADLINQCNKFLSKTDKQAVTERTTELKKHVNEGSGI